MTWNHRVVRRTYKYATMPDKYLYQIHEVYYNEEGEVDSYTLEPVANCGNTLVELAEEIEMFKKCLNHPVLIWEELPGYE